MSKRQLFGEYEIQVKRSSKGRCLTAADTVSVTEEKPDLSNYVDTAAVLNVLDKTIALLDSVRQRIKSK